jgi:N12 class adenine-specific DNA methylase
MGLARKPLFVVPNHMLGQFSSELLTLYPGANILVATKDDFEKDKRKTLMSRINGHCGIVCRPSSRRTSAAVTRLLKAGPAASPCGLR